MKRMGWAIDWDREVSTHEPDYYRWTQWLFLRFFEKGLAYRKEAPVNWCPNDQTVLANEQVIDGRCERCGAEVERRNLEQWFFRITAYADQLLDEMSLLESWPERVLTMQRNWIGRSEGAEVVFRIEELDVDIPVFTTRPDTLFGATFFVLAPEHPLVPQLVAGTPHEQEVLEYVRQAAGRSAVERADPRRRRPASSRAVRHEPGQRGAHPDLGRRLRADGVRHRRDHGRARARRARLRVRAALRAAGDGRRRGRGRGVEEGAFVAHTEDERLVNSAQFSGLSGPEAKRRSSSGSSSASAAGRRSATACATGCSRASATGAARSRSSTATSAGSCRCPMRTCPCCCPRSRSTCRRAARRWPPPRTGCARPARRCGGEARRETDTMDTFVDSSWYFIRYCDPHNEDAPSDRGSPTTGCRSTSTSAASSTRSCTCSTRASSRR